jgi:ketosteroid isomerase-like protein
MQENHAAPRVGRENLVAHERKVLARARSVRSRCVRPVFVSGDRVVIRWIFDFEWRDGSSTHMEELAYQRWAGERIAEEQFFYDPAQLAKR